ncbi:MAG: hypothetical protein A2W85_02685 [Bacteroidetes bacterium GWF2_41_31]|nr:MAG: hypothetical protein A2W85_02685 [Bacteroidetes bacterium GWF2_41_31]
MKNIDIIRELETEIYQIRSNLMIKGMELDIAKQNFTQEKVAKIETLTTEVQELRKQLSELNAQLQKLKFAYYVSYEVKLLNPWTNQMDREIYHETILLDKNLNIDLPQGGEWNLYDSDINKLLLDTLLYLKHKYDEVTLLRIKRIKNI